MQNFQVSYDNAAYDDNVYGHALALLEKHRPVTQADATSIIHLDIGCGYGRIAEPLVRSNNLKYVGIDGDLESLTSLRDRGFEVHQVDLESSNIQGLLDKIVGDRTVASVTFLDTLEHLINGDRVLAALSSIVAKFRSPVVISVPNMTHQDIALRLLSGSFEYTAAGLLDHTHVRMFGARSLVRMLNHCCLHKIDAYDVVRERSDQWFPASNPLLSEHTAIGRAARSIRQNAEESSHVNQFIWACLSGPQTENKYYFEPQERSAPFLSIITRTQGTRPECLNELLTCLAGQSCTDFEVLIIGHRLTIDQQIGVERGIEDSPEWLRGKLRLVKVDSGNRTRPLNVGFEEAKGEYVAILDDDDLPMGNWVEVFKELANLYPGRTLRASNVRQNVEKIKVLGMPAIRAVGSLDTLYPPHFDFVRHLVENQTPNHCLAFPRGVFHDLNIRFDETLTTTEDWDFILRVTSISDVACSPKITSIYRWWTSHESSRTEHAQSEWEDNYNKILAKTDHELFFIPSGAIQSIRALIARNRALEAEATYLRAIADPQSKLPIQLGSQTGLDSMSIEVRRQVLEILHSNSWKISMPLRWAGKLRGTRGSITPAAVGEMNLLELWNTLVLLKGSRSWRATAVIRKMRGLSDPL